MLPAAAAEAAPKALSGLGVVVRGGTMPETGPMTGPLEVAASAAAGSAMTAASAASARKKDMALPRRGFICDPTPSRFGKVDRLRKCTQRSRLGGDPSSKVGGGAIGGIPRRGGCGLAPGRPG